MASSQVRSLSAHVPFRVRAAVTAVVTVLALALVTAGTSADRVASAAPDPRPNLLLIETDDQTVKSMRVMDRVNRMLGREGTTFTNSFASWPLCCPSRASMLTGQYAHNHGVLGNGPPHGGYQRLDGSNTVAVWLQRAGYHTTHLGKYLNGYGYKNPAEVPPGWTDWHGAIGNTAYNYRDFTLNENGTLNRYQGEHQTDVYGRKAASMVRRDAARDEPFFTSVAFTAPHSGRPHESDDPSLPTPSVAGRHENAFAGEPLPRPRSFDEANVSDKPRYIRQLPRLTAGARAAVREGYQQRLESLLAVDEAVARILRSLERTGEADNTIVVFTSDNGFFFGEHRVDFGKKLPYEEAARVPLIVRGPGFPAGVKRTQNVANIDLAPTLVRAAGAEPGRVMDGRSLRPLAADRRAGQGRSILLESLGDVEEFGLTQYAAVRSPRYYYADYDYTSGPGNRELYDMRRDPFQLQSRHANSGYAKTRNGLTDELRRLRNCAGASCR